MVGAGPGRPTSHMAPELDSAADGTARFHGQLIQWVGSVVIPGVPTDDTGWAGPAHRPGRAVSGRRPGRPGWGGSPRAEDCSQPGRLPPAGGLHLP